MTRGVVACLVALMLSANAKADPDFPAHDLQALSQALQALKAKKGRLDRVYMLASAMQVDESGSDPVPPNASASMAAARRLLAVFRVGDVSLAMPDLDAFQALARQYGRPADVELFRLLHRTYPDSHTPSYVTQTGDHTRCTNFAPGVFVPLYGDWVRFSKAHPNDYAELVRREVTAIEQELRGGKCACTSARKATASLRDFVKAYPRGDVTPEVEGRLDQIKRHRPDLHFDCLGLDQ